jgi:CRP/FNR family transcriptional regulator, cyclic AMP receptor protein
MNNLDTIDQCLRKAPLFAWMNTESIGWLAHYTEELAFAGGETILSRNSESDALYLIAEGEVTFISGTSPDTDEQTASTLEEGDVFGELSLLEKKSRHSLARAALPTRLYRIKASTMQDFAKTNQDQHAILLTNLARELARKIRSLNARKSTHSDSIT